MNIRVIALCIFITFFCIYAWKDWFKSLCSLILLMAVIEHEAMPKTILGIQGFNMWNVLFLITFLAWIVNRCREGQIWDMPRHVNVLLLMYLGVILVNFLRAVFDRSNIEDYTLVQMFSEELINTIKWVLPGILIFDGCRTRRRLVMALVCLLAMYFLISVQVIRRIPIFSIYSGWETIVILRKRCVDIGYCATDMSVMLAGASWGILAILPLFKKKYRVILFGLSGMVVVSQALTGGRGGYVAWTATGLMLCLIKWRKYLILVPVVVILLPIVFPGPTQRMLMGFGHIDVSGQVAIDEEALTSGRSVTWPYVIDKIIESPLVGYGRLAMKRTGLEESIESDYPGTNVPHPHNMYLETLLDNGILGSIPIFVFFGMMTVYSARLFRSSNRLCSATGGMSLALTLSSLFAGISGQHFYPQEQTLGIWVAMFLLLRVYVEERRAQTDTVNAENLYDNPAFTQQQTAIAFVHA